MKVGFEIFPKPIMFTGYLADFPIEVKQHAFKRLDQIANKARRRIASLTPGVNLPKGWKIRRQGGKNFRFRFIENADPRAYAPVPLKSGGTTNLVEMMEYGTKPHEIVPVNKKWLRFTVGGRVVYTKHVEHPGTKPYAFHAITYAEAARDIGNLQFELAGMLKKFGGVK